MTVVSLFQLGPVHEEVSLGFCQALLKLGVDVKVWLHQESFNKKGDVYSYFSGKTRIDIRYHSTKLNKYAETDLLHKVLDDKPDLIILLTLQNTQTEYVADFFVRQNIRVAGVVHNNVLIRKSKVLSEAFNSGKYCPLFLSPHVKRDSADWNVNSKSFVVYNVFSPNLVVNRQSNDHIFSILGGVSWKRLAYDELMQAVISNKDRWTKRLRLQIVGGGADRALIQEIAQQNGIENIFMFSDLDSGSKMTSYSKYYECLSGADAVLCLPRKGVFNSVAISKITSSVPSALSFGKPLICSPELAQRHHVCSSSVTGSNLSDQINNMLDEFDAYSSYSHLNQAALVLREVMDDSNVKVLSQFIDSVYAGS